MKPLRVRVVVERDDRLEAQRDEALDESAVARESDLVEGAPARFDPAPRNGEAEGVRAEARREHRVLLVAPPRVRRAPARAAFRVARGFPVRPVARIAPLDLVVRQCHAEKPRPIRERKDAHVPPR